MQNNRIVSQDEWLAARKAHLKSEKALTRMRDLVAAERRALPWVKVEKEYVFDTPEGKRTLAELFDERSQLIIYHFMMGPDWEQGCVGCSFLCDHVDGANQHLMQHDVTFVAVSRAPLAKIESYKKRMGWRFPWVSSYGSDFNFDYHVSFTPEEVTKGKAYYNYEIQDVGIDELSGRSVFFKDAGATFFTLTHPMRAEETHFSAHTTISTSRPKAATRPVPATI